MNPNQLPSYSPTSPQGGGSKKLLIALAVVVVVIIVAVLVFLKPQSGNSSGKLSISSTSPDVKEITTQTSSLAVQFNQDLQAGSASVTSDPQIVASTSISGNTLTIAFKDKTLLSTKQYTVTIKSISSTTGQQLTSQDLSFTPTLQQPSISGENALSDRGLSATQVGNTVSYIAQFDPWAKAVIINESSLKHFRLNPTDAWSPWALSFSMSVDGTNYNVIGSYFDPEHIQVKIYDPTTGQQLFAAGDQGSI